MGNNTFFPAQEHRKMTCREQQNHERWLTGNSKITEDVLPGPTKSARSCKSSSMIWRRRKVILLNLKSGFYETSCLKSMFRGQAILASCKPELSRGSVSHLPGTEKSRIVLWLDKVISENLELLKLDSCSSREIVSLKSVKKNCRTSSF